MDSKSDEEISILFSKNSPIHTLSECEGNLSLSDRLRLFAYGENSCLRSGSDFQSERSLLIRLLEVTSVSDRVHFTDDEIEYLEKMNLQLDIPRVYFLTEKSGRNVVNKFISLGYYEEISQRYYTTETMGTVAKLGKVRT